MEALLLEDFDLVNAFIWLERTQQESIVDSIWYVFYSNDQLDDLHDHLIQLELSHTCESLNVTCTITITPL